MTDGFNDDINFGKLQRELDDAVVNDLRYRQKNDAKFRAVHQKVANYDEFRAIVEASHLNPLEKGDKIGGMIYQKWNKHCDDDKKLFSATSSSEQQAAPSRQLNYDPCTYQDFMDCWRGLDVNQRRSYIFEVAPDSLEQCLKLECPVGEILASLYDADADNDKVVEILQVMTRTKRFKLQLAFVDDGDLEKLKLLFDRLAAYDPDREIIKKLHAVYL